MSLALYIVVDAIDPGFDVFVEGKAIAQAADEIDALCEEVGLPLLDSFVGQEADALERFEDDAGEDDEDDTADTGQWFDAADGVAWVQAVIDLIQEQPDALEDPEGVLQDLNDIQHVLELTQAARLRWHFAWDF
ncbi:hypothetical protein AAV94_13555 [Lampropedia cohaerens]|uniref:Uncharacterized protein n=1 Tax=Lampropedia cohaerens TaxID=1610491 RepID=A0A0U1PW64_9BURK|nr:hypothetical protein [Lampropedia cohaerens]KKW66782.1 hypothetical protein AAV94_13555 [Lampropedia cohaerens]